MISATELICLSVFLCVLGLTDNHSAKVIKRTYLVSVLSTQNLGSSSKVEIEPFVCCNYVFTGEHFDTSGSGEAVAGIRVYGGFLIDFVISTTFGDNSLCCQKNLEVGENFKGEGVIFSINPVRGCLFLLLCGSVESSRVVHDYYQNCIGNFFIRDSGILSRDFVISTSTNIFANLLEKLKVIEDI